MKKRSKNQLLQNRDEENRDEENARHGSEFSENQSL